MSPSVLAWGAAVAVASTAQLGSLSEIPSIRPAAPAMPADGINVVDPDGRIDSVERRMEAIETLTADFVQVNEYGFAALADTFDGELLVRMPDDFLLRYHNPEGQFILSDGATMSMYVPDNEQVVRGRITRAGEDLNFFRLILGYLRRSDAEVRELENGRFAIHLLPTADPVVRQLDLEVDEASFLPVSFSMVDTNGNRSTYRLSRIRPDTEIAAAVFRVDVPDGVEIVDP